MNSKHPFPPSASLPDLFSHPAEPPSVAVDTSMDAAERIKPLARSMRLRVLNTILAYDGLTCDQVEALLGLRHQTAAARCWELEGQGLIEKSETKRATRSGSQARVYQVTAKGRQQVAA